LSATGACRFLELRTSAVDDRVVIHVARPRHKHVKKDPPAPRPRRRRLARRGLAVAAVFAVTTPVAAVVWPLEGTVESESVPTAAPARSPRSPAPMDVAPPFEREVAVEVQASPAGTADRKPAKKAREARTRRSRDAKGRGASSTEKVTTPGAPQRNEPEGAVREVVGSVTATEPSSSRRGTGPGTTSGAPTEAPRSTETDTAADTRSPGGASATDPAPRSTPQNAQEPSPQPAPAPTPDPTPQPTPDARPTPEPEPEPTPEPAPIPVPAADPCVPPSDWWLVVESAGPDAVCTTLPE